MHYTLHQLQIFQKIVETESITKAAEELFLTQPAVSIQLKKFQDQFSIPLTEVIGRKLYVTDFGHEIAAAAQVILSEVEAINYKTMIYNNQLAGKLKISVASTGKYVMPYFLAEFMREHRGVDLMMDVTNKSLVVKSMEQNEVDFSLVSVIPQQLNINQVELLENKLFLVCSPKLNPAGKKSADQLIKEHPWIYREQGSATRMAMETFIEGRKLSGYKKIELTSNEAVKQAVVAGLGLSIMPLIGLKNVLQSGEMQIMPYPGLPVTTKWNLIWHHAKKLSPVANAYLEHINQHKERIRMENFQWYTEY